MKLLRELVKEAWAGDVQGVAHAQARAAEKDWQKKAAARDDIGWSLEVRKGNKTIKLDKVYPSMEDAKKAAITLKLPDAKPVRAYGK